VSSVAAMSNKQLRDTVMPGAAGLPYYCVGQRCGVCCNATPALKKKKGKNQIIPEEKV